MRATARAAVLVVAALLPLGCGTSDADVGPVSEDAEIATLPLDPATFTLRVRTALEESGSFEVTLTQTGRGGVDVVEGVWHAGADRVADEMTWADVDPSGTARHWVRADGQVCLDAPARADLAAAGVGGVVVVPDRPWGCAATQGRDAALAAMAGRSPLLWSPLHRLTALGPATEVEHIGVEETAEGPLDHYRFDAAPSVPDPSRDADLTTYDVWLDAEQRLRAMEAAGERWELSDVGAAPPVALPEPDERGELRRAGAGAGSFRP